MPPSSPSPQPRPEGPALAGLATEAVRSELAHLDLMSADDLVRLMAEDSRRATEAVLRAAPAISAAVATVVSRLAGGGRMVYVGAGSAGRLGVLDAAELGPTFDLPAGVVEAVIAGGERAVQHAVEGAEDDQAEGGASMGRLGVGPGDVVVGISASGRTPFVVGALQQARELGAATVAISCNTASTISSAADQAIEIVVGGEVLAGSSRMNAGTAQKIVLNIISTAAMVQLGKTYGNLMVDMRATNSKLRDRATRIVEAVSGVAPDKAAAALGAAGWNTKLACLIAVSGLDAASAAELLDNAGGKLRLAIDRVAAVEAPAPARPGDAPT